jgi:hypothetical protein
MCGLKEPEVLQTAVQLRTRLVQRVLDCQQCCTAEHTLGQMCFVGRQKGWASSMCCIMIVGECAGCWDCFVSRVCVSSLAALQTMG